MRGSCSLSVASATATTLTVVLLHAWDKLSDTEVLDHLLKDSIVLGEDVADLNLGLLWDEIHLSLSFLLS